MHDDMTPLYFLQNTQHQQKLFVHLCFFVIYCGPLLGSPLMYDSQSSGLPLPSLGPSCTMRGPHICTSPVQHTTTPLKAEAWQTKRELVAIYLEFHFKKLYWFMPG